MSGSARFPFARCLFCFQLGQDPAAALTVARRLIPGPTAVSVLAHLRSTAHFWHLGTEAEVPPEPGPPHHELALLLEGWADPLDGAVVDRFDLDAVTGAAEAFAADAILLGPLGSQRSQSLAWIEEVADRTGRPVLYLGGSFDERRPGDPLSILCPFDRDVRQASAAGVFLRDRTVAGDKVTLVSLGEPDPPIPDPSGLAALAGIEATVALDRLEGGVTELTDRFAKVVRKERADLVVVAAGAIGGLSGLLLRVLGRDLLPRLAAPVLLLPRASAASPSRSGQLDAPDVLATGRRLLPILVERLDLLGQPGELACDRLAVVGHGRLLDWLPMSGGLGRLDLEEGVELPDQIGLGRAPEDLDDRDPLSLVEARVAVVDPGPRRLVLLDAELPPRLLRKAMALLTGCRGAAHPALLAVVRLGEGPSFRSIRKILHAADLDRLPVFDAGAILDDGEPEDLPGGIEDVRLVRSAARLRASGIDVEAVVTGRDRPLQVGGFVYLTASELRAADAEELRSRIDAEFRPVDRDRVASDPLGLALDETTGSRVVPGNRISIEFDGLADRRRTLDRIDRATERIHIETFILREDPITRELEEHLRRAARRGVRIRLLVDSLWSFHGSFGQTNPVVERLEREGGFTARAFRPIEGFPAKADLKLRDHRKLIVIDRTVGVVTGRNLAASYWTGFEEVALTAETPAEEVPWLDAGAIVEGPIVAAIDRSFHLTWLEAGGDPFDVGPVEPAGGAACRLILHECLEDAHTLDAYLALIRTAEREIDIVNTFPLQEELQHALLEAIDRGVRVRVLVGNVRPHHGQPPVPFPGGAIRELATQVVHGRIDALVAAGGEAHEIALSGVAGWDPGLDPVRVHCHAKLLLADRRRTTIGSANLDITAGYWDREAMLLIDDEAVAAAVGRRIDAMLETSIPIDRNDPRWKELAARRSWISRNWPSILG